MTEEEAIAIVKTAGFQRFSNALRILINIDRSELEQAIGPISRDEWAFFRQTPWRAFITWGDMRAAGLWEIIESRQPDRVRPAP